ncbi:hypothetical protein [Chelatococcus sp. XZ-Ab1]|uniref:hypothetical protein n=1 Tax=Chelatococcus sp. XZ-Ab1 TaxID=3034027 RepID=UPI0023E39800|nr:hypothetical protein [Chelatococcus sp. XZ-Ab1]
MKRRNKPAFRDIARDIAVDSIVTQALARLIEQIVEEIHAAEIAPMRRRAAQMENALRDAQKRLRGAGMLGGDDDPVNAALEEGRDE